MSLTINAKTYTADRYAGDSVIYNGPGNTLTVSDVIRLATVKPKPTPTFSGVGRASAKLTRTMTLTGVLTPSGQSLVEVNVSVPVGAASADVDALLDDVGAYLSSAAAKTLVKNQQISY